MKLSKIPNLPNALGALFVFYSFFAKFLVVISPLAKKKCEEPNIFPDI